MIKQKKKLTKCTNNLKEGPQQPQKSDALQRM